MTKTTLRELSHKYASILRKCALLNAMVLMTALPAMADMYKDSITIAAGASDDLADYYETHEGIDIDKLEMGAGSTLQFTDGQNNTYIKNGTFTGTVDFSTGTDETNSRSIRVVNATLEDVDFVGKFNGGDKDSWDNYNGMNANSLSVSGKVFLKDADIMMSTTSMKGDSFFETYSEAEAYDLTKEYDTAGEFVTYNGGLYKTTAAVLNTNYFDRLTAGLTQKTGDDIPTTVDEIEDYTKVLDLTKTYKAGEYFLMVNPEDGTVTGYQVGEGGFKAPSPVAGLEVVSQPVAYESGVKIENAQLKMSCSNLAGEQSFTAEQGAILGMLMKPVAEQLYEDLDDGQTKDDLGDLLENFNAHTFLSMLEDSVYDEDGNKLDEVDANIEAAYTKASRIDDDYSLAVGIRVENLPVTVKDSFAEIGNGSRIAKESTGALVIENSQLDILGGQMNPNNFADNISSIDHWGYQGDVLIQKGSTVNLYANSGILRGSGTDDDEDGSWLGSRVLEGAKGNVVVQNSTINMYGRANEDSANAVYTSTIDNEEELPTSLAIAPAVILVDNEKGNLQLTDNSSLNVYGDDNRIYIRNANLGTKDDALYAIKSKINIEPNAKLSLYYYDDGDKLGGKIALDQEGVINLKGTLDADIISLTPSITLTKNVGDMTNEEKKQLKLADNFGRVNLYNGARLNGIIDGVNVFVSDKNTALGGGLTIQGGAVLNLGTNLLTTTALSSNASLIETTIASKNEYGALNVSNLTFNNSLVRVNVDMDLEEGESVEIPFLTGDTTKLSTEDFYNTKYDFEYKNGKLILTRNGNSGMISVDELNEVVSAADAWSNPDSFASGSPAQIIAMRLNNLQKNNSAEFEKIVKKVQPTDTNQGHQVANQTNQQVVGAANDRMGGSGHYGNNGNHGNNNNNAHTNNGQHNGTGGQNTNGNHYGTQVGRSGGDTFNNVGMWVQGLYNHAKLSGSDGYTGKSKGVAMGMDGMITDNLKLGFGYAYSTTDVDADDSNTDVNTHTGMLYGEYTFGNAFVNAAGTYGYSTYEGKRDLLGTAIKSDYNMDALYGQVMTGYNFDLTNISLTPETGLRYLWTKTHSYTEKPIDQHVSSSKSSTLTGVIGGRVGMMFATEKATFMPELKLAATYDLKRDNGGSSVRLANGASYQVEGESLKRFGVETGAKIGMTIDNIDVSLSYEGRFKKDYQDHTGMINFRYNF